MSLTHRRLTLLAVLVAAVLATLSLVVVASPANAATVSQPLRTMIANLPVATEVRTGYDRDLFNHWIDADGDGCNTRYEVLIAEAVTAPTVGSSCGLTGGRWYSYYDGLYWTLPADLDIDHFVPLAEAWDSGARDWTSAQRESYANDLATPVRWPRSRTTRTSPRAIRTRRSGCRRSPASTAATSRSGRR